MTGADDVPAPAVPSILHVDMDAFYAAVEVLHDPSLAGRPLIVGGSGRRGVVASCSYEARTFGVRSAMPSAVARRLCPGAVFVDGHFDRYADCSQAIHRIFDRYTPLVEGIALDEAFLDVGGASRLVGPAPEIAGRIRVDVRTEVGLACSVGVATTKLVAKLASEAAKPTARPNGVDPGAGVVVVAPGRELEFLHPLPVEALWGVGPATSARLRRLGITTVGQLASVPAGSVESALGRAGGRHLHQLAHGIDPRPVQPDRAPKSMGHEETWARDRHDAGEVHDQLVRMADAVSSRLRAGGVGGRTVTLKVRFGDFETVTRSRSLPVPADTGPILARVATALLGGVEVSRGVRLVGLSVSSLVPAPGGAPEPAGVATEQLAFDLPGGPGDQGGQATALAGRSRSGGGADGRRSWRAAAAAVDRVRRRFGDVAVGPATLLGPGGLVPKRRGDQQWGPAGEPATGRAPTTSGGSAPSARGSPSGAGVAVRCIKTSSTPEVSPTTGL
ncbi:MAG: DNA polymerase IV [Acidimicrobiales bacterium]